MNRGFGTVEILLTILCTTVLIGTTAAVHFKIQKIEATKKEAGDLDLAQNFLAKLRQGSNITLPKGWTLDKKSEGGVICIILPSGVKLCTIVE